MKLIATVGLPGSGKSYWAKEEQKKDPNTILVCKDDLRAMLHQGVYSRGREQIIISVRNAIIIEALEEGHNVIVHDTNLAKKHLEVMKNISQQTQWNGKCEFLIKEFTDVPLQTCIERDAKRPNSVGKKVIMDMYRQFLHKPVQLVEYTPNLPFAVIFDVDGTLALFGNKNPYERDFINDNINHQVNELRIQMGKKYKTIILSGRKDKYRDETLAWFEKQGITFDEFYMRKSDDDRKDAIVKREIYETLIKPKYNIWMVIDDRNQVVDMWRNELGLTCLQVADGDF